MRRLAIPLVASLRDGFLTPARGRRRRPLLTALPSLIACVLVLAVAAPALAQSTGSSFGGGDWGSSGSSDYGSDYGSGSTDYGSTDYGSSDYGSSSSDYGSSDYGSSSSGGSLGGAIFAVLVLLGIAAVVFLPQKWTTLRSKGPASRGWSKVDVTAMRLAIDWRARADVQRKLDALARSGATSSKQGLARLLRETVDTLRSARLSWLYAGVSNYRPMSQAMAQGIFAQLTVDARSRFRRELLRSADGVVYEQDAGALRAQPHEGEGVVVVTLVVAARRELRDVARATDASQLGALLVELRALGGDLVALEVIWSPSADGDRMSTAELTALYPDLARLDDRSVGGRVFCGHCGGPYAHELKACPHCGAPSPAVARS